MTTETAAAAPPAETADSLFEQHREATAAMRKSGATAEEWLAFYQAEHARWEKIWDLAIASDFPRWSVFAAGIVANRARFDAENLRRTLAARVAE